MKVAVTGGTGYVGPAIVQALVAAGHDVRVLVHRTAAKVGTPVEADLFDAASLDRAFAGTDAVVHLVAIRRGTPAAFERMHSEATRNVVDAAKRAGVRRFLLMSANDADVGTLDASAAASALRRTAAAATPYFRTKREMERIVRASGLAWTIFRPSYVAGPGGFDLEFAKIVDKAPLLPSFAGGRFEIQPITREDVALAFARALARDVAIGKTYVLVGPERFTWREYLTRLATVRGRRRARFAHVPRAAILAVATVLGRTFPASPDELRMLMMGSVGDPEPAVRDLGLTLHSWESAVAPLARAARAAPRAIREG